MGLLDNKSRVLDTVITQEGRRQLATGRMIIEYVSFTDATTFYEADVVSGSTDAGERIYFEANSSLQDSIAFEADDSGLLQANPGFFRNGIGISNGKILSSSNSFLEFVTGTNFASLGSNLLSASIDNFKNLRIISSIGPFDDDTEFVLNSNSIAFNMTNNSPVFADGIPKKSVDETEDLFGDPLLSHIPNFSYMPPVNSPVSFNDSPTQLGDFKPLGQSKKLEPDEVMNEIKVSEELGQTIDISFVETSRGNNIFSQFFELRSTGMIKLDVIDYGSFFMNDSNSSRHVFFVGKIYKNSLGATVFMRLFTLMFYDDDNIESIFA